MLNLDTSDKNDCFSPKNGIQVLECLHRRTTRISELCHEQVFLTPYTFEHAIQKYKNRENRNIWE